MIACEQCTADEFHVIENGDWVCSNGHVQNWTVVPDRGQRGSTSPPAAGRKYRNRGDGTFELDPRPGGVERRPYA